MLPRYTALDLLARYSHCARTLFATAIAPLHLPFAQHATLPAAFPLTRSVHCLHFTLFLCRAHLLYVPAAPPGIAPPRCLHAPRQRCLPLRNAVAVAAHASPPAPSPPPHPHTPHPCPQPRPHHPPALHHHHTPTPAHLLLPTPPGPGRTGRVWQHAMPGGLDHDSPAARGRQKHPHWACPARCHMPTFHLLYPSLPGDLDGRTVGLLVYLRFSQAASPPVSFSSWATDGGRDYGPSKHCTEGG